MNTRTYAMVWPKDVFGRKLELGDVICYGTKDSWGELKIAVITDYEQRWMQDNVHLCPIVTGINAKRKGQKVLKSRRQIFRLDEYSLPEDQQKNIARIHKMIKFDKQESSLHQILNQEEDLIQAIRKACSREDLYDKNVLKSFVMKRIKEESEHEYIFDYIDSQYESWQC